MQSGCAAALTLVFVSETTSARETGKDALAAQVRAQGLSCGTVKSAQHDEKRSKPNEEVWVLTCDNAIYRMRVVPDMGAKIEQLKE